MLGEPPNFLRDTLSIHNSFTSGYQLVRQTQLIREWKHMDKIEFHKTTQNIQKIDPLGIPTHVHSNSPSVSNSSLTSR